MDPSVYLHDMIETISRLSGAGAYCAIVGVLLLCGFGLPIPEDLTLITAGLLISTQSVSTPGALIASFFGVLLGDSILFFLGRRYGRRVFTLPGLRRFFTVERVAGAEARIHNHGPFICFIARFLPGLRTPIFAMSGALGVKPTTFLLLDGFAALLSVPLWLYVGYWVGTRFDDTLTAAFNEARRLQSYVLATVVSLFLLYVLYRFVQARTQGARDFRMGSKSISPSIAEQEKRN